jgi:hypothetical protein
MIEAITWEKSLRINDDIFFMSAFDKIMVLNKIKKLKPNNYKQIFNLLEKFLKIGSIDI